MRVALVGNNDGPLTLARAMLANDRYPVCIGLQNPVSKELQADYRQLIGREDFFSGFTEPRLLEVLQSFDFDVLVNCFCNFKFKKLLDRYTVLNVHLAPLPLYRGRHPLHWALINGETEFGFTVHRMDAEYDTGEIYWQEKVPVELGMSVTELRSALMKELEAGFENFLGDYEKGILTSRPNPDTEATYAPKRRPEDSLLTEWQDRDTIYRKVMALRSGNHPAYLKVDGKKITVTAAELEGSKTNPEEADSGKSSDGKAKSEKSSYRKEDSGKSASKKIVLVDRLHKNGMSVVCKDGKRIGLYGFNPKEHNVIKNQELL